MTFREAQDTMMEFATKYAGKTVFFDELKDETEKLAFVLTDQWQFFRFLKTGARMQRAIDNALGHQKNGFEVYAEYHESMAFAEE